MADIFLSYAEGDRETARQVARSLEAIGWSVWWDRKTPAGMTWRQVIETAINEMHCMVVLWSSRSIASAWVAEEAEEGRARGKLVPVLIEPVVPPLGFRGIQAADLIKWDGEIEAPGFQQLVADLQPRFGLSPRPPPVATVDTPPPPQGVRFPRRAVAVTGVAMLLVVASWAWYSQREYSAEPASAAPVGGNPATPAAATPNPPLPSSATVVLPKPPLRLPDAPASQKEKRTDSAPAGGDAPVVQAHEKAAQPTRAEKTSSPRRTETERCVALQERAQLGDPGANEDLKRECLK
jgi:hypothetical protein